MEDGRKTGTVLPSYSWEQLHDLVRTPESIGPHVRDPTVAGKVLRLKRKWVGVQLARLEDRGLVERMDRPGRRPQLVVLRDDGSGLPFDDPDGTPGNRYVRILGSVISTGALATWDTPRLSAFLAAMAAERHDDAARGIARRDAGMGRWFRPLRWFADAENRFAGLKGRIDRITGLNVVAGQGSSGA